MVVPLSARRSLAMIEHDFQVVSESTKWWEPKLYGAIPLPSAWVPGRELLITEGKLLDKLIWGKGINGLYKFRDIASEAFEEAERQYPIPASATLPPVVAAKIAGQPAAERAEATRMWFTNDGHMDAFRHCYWNARLTMAFGRPWTRAFCTAHEGGVGNPAAREAMDLFNNAIGRGIGVLGVDGGSKWAASRVRQAVDEGELVVVGLDGHLAWSDQVKVWEHGITDAASNVGVLKTPGVVSAW